MANLIVPVENPDSRGRVEKSWPVPRQFELATLIQGALMLVLSRHVGEKILIGKDVIITIVRIDANTVNVGIAAPRDVVIDRMEKVVAARKHLDA
jgi:carbon storage regulator